ncbi:MAG: F0F1 ATP synthase subunit B, partial [Bacteroidetes bacterium]|nr:F0F1 ATP synthase subunit B [Bacteroidota bacterium]
MLDINPGLIIWTIITFVLLVIVLGKFAWKPILQALQTREQEIADALKKAEDAKKDAERMMQENKIAMEKVTNETARLIAEGRTMAEQLKNDIVAKANESAKKMMDQAKDEIGREKESAMAQLRTEVAELSIIVAEKILDESLDSAKQKKMVDKVLQQLQNN